MFAERSAEIAQADALLGGDLQSLAHRILVACQREPDIFPAPTPHQLFHLGDSSVGLFQPELGIALRAEADDQCRTLKPTFDAVQIVPGERVSRRVGDSHTSD